MNANQPAPASLEHPTASTHQDNAAGQPTATDAAIENLDGGLVHFDATLIRKQRLRQAATGSHAARAKADAASPLTQPAHATSTNGETDGFDSVAKGLPPRSDATSATDITSTQSPQASSSTAAPSDWWQRVMRDFNEPQATASEPPSMAVHSSQPEAPQQPQLAVKPESPVQPLESADEPKLTTTAPPTQALDSNRLRAFLVDFVVEQTGYPEEIVELDADLEADLGIDSIKKAQMFGEIGEHYGLQPDENLSLDDFTTLDHVLQYLLKTLSAGKSPNSVKSLHERAPGTNGSSAGQTPTNVVDASHVEAAPAAAAVSPTDSASPSTADLKSFLVDFVVEQTGYPEEIVELDADLEADLGIDSIKKAQMFGEIGEYFGLQQDENMSLDDFPTLNDVLNYLRANV